MFYSYYKLKPFFERHFYETKKNRFTIEDDEYDMMCRELSSNPHLISIIQDRNNKLMPSCMIDWNRVSANANAIELLKQNPDKINWGELSKNSNGIELLLTNQDKINWRNLSENTNIKAVDLLRKNQDKIEWNRLSRNINAVDILRDNPTKVNWNILHSNQSPEIIELLLEYPELIDWDELSESSNAIELLYQNPEKIDLYCLLWNKNIVDLIELRPDLLELLYEIDEDCLMVNIWNNPKIFEFDYKAFTRHMHYDTGLFDEFYKKMLHPRNFPKFNDWGLI